MKGTLTAAHGQKGRPLECIVMETHGKTWMQWISSNGAPIRIEVLQVDIVTDFQFFSFAAHGGARARATRFGILKPRDYLEKLLDVSSILQTMSIMEDLIFDQGRIGDSHYQCFEVLAEPHAWRAWCSRLLGHAWRALCSQWLGDSASKFLSVA